MSTYKDDIVEKIGGQSQYDYVKLSYCESIRDDLELNVFFAHLDLDALMELQAEFLDAAFLDLPHAETETLVGRLMVKHRMLWKMGMDETHFEKLKSHFVMALQECWADDDLTLSANKHFDRLRPLFQQSDKFSKSSSSSLSRSQRSYHRTAPIPMQRGA